MIRNNDSLCFHWLNLGSYQLLWPWPYFRVTGHVERGGEEIEIGSSSPLISSKPSQVVWLFHTCCTQSNVNWKCFCSCYCMVNTSSKWEWLASWNELTFYTRAKRWSGRGLLNRILSNNLLPDGICCLMTYFFCSNMPFSFWLSV